MNEAKFMNETAPFTFILAFAPSLETTSTGVKTSTLPTFLPSSDMSVVFVKTSAFKLIAAAQAAIKANLKLFIALP